MRLSSRVTRHAGEPAGEGTVDDGDLLLADVQANLARADVADAGDDGLVGDDIVGVVEWICGGSTGEQADAPIAPAATPVRARKMRRDTGFMTVLLAVVEWRTK